MMPMHLIQFLLLWLLSYSPWGVTAHYTYFHYDATGTAIMATDEQANVLWKRAPTAYGETPEAHPAMKKYNHRMTVAGHYDDWETGLIYMGKRYYSPKLGRFLTPDPVGVYPHLPDTFNRYGYANNNPYSYIDPTGNSPLHISRGVWGASGWVGRGVYTSQEARIASMLDRLIPWFVGGSAVLMNGQNNHSNNGGFSSGTGDPCLSLPILCDNKGSGPTAGVISINRSSTSTKALQNYYPNRSIEFVFDPQKNTFAVGVPKRGFTGSPHQQLARSIQADESTVVGGRFFRGVNGEIFTDEWSGHYYQNWTPEIRLQFQEFMKSRGVPINHGGF